MSATGQGVTQARGWEASLDLGLLERLARPLREPCLLLRMDVVRRILDGITRLQARHSLAHELLRRRNVRPDAHPALPIVDAQWATDRHVDESDEQPGRLASPGAMASPAPAPAVVPVPVPVVVPRWITLPAAEVAELAVEPTSAHAEPAALVSQIALTAASHADRDVVVGPGYAGRAPLPHVDAMADARVAVRPANRLPLMIGPVEALPVQQEHEPSPHSPVPTAARHAGAEPEVTRLTAPPRTPSPSTSTGHGDAPPLVQMTPQVEHERPELLPEWSGDGPVPEVLSAKADWPDAARDAPGAPTLPERAAVAPGRGEEPDLPDHAPRPQASARALVASARPEAAHAVIDSPEATVLAARSAETIATRARVRPANQLPLPSESARDGEIPLRPRRMRPGMHSHIERLDEPTRAREGSRVADAPQRLGDVEATVSAPAQSDPSAMADWRRAGSGGVPAQTRSVSTQEASAYPTHANLPLVVATSQPGRQAGARATSLQAVDETARGRGAASEDGTLAVASPARVIVRPTRRLTLASTRDRHDHVPVVHGGPHSGTHASPTPLPATTPAAPSATMDLERSPFTVAVVQAQPVATTMHTWQPEQDPSATATPPEDDLSDNPPGTRRPRVVAAEPAAQDPIARAVQVPLTHVHPGGAGSGASSGAGTAAPGGSPTGHGQPAPASTGSASRRRDQTQPAGTQNGLATPVVSPRPVALSEIDLDTLTEHVKRRLVRQLEQERIRRGHVR